VSGKDPRNTDYQRYGYDGGGLQLANAGALLVGELSGAKARLLQMVALGGTRNRPEAVTIVQRLIGAVVSGKDPRNTDYQRTCGFRSGNAVFLPEGDR